ncbi:UDP-N-acetylmuramate dehydrogenase [Undibacterium sp. CY18W]|uniref:UDP-N-acetylenolpyruvoylglucosamine reductase n=1 Tax=Undibacterium hunanense TaxID=2762292 RepID=A0ABR6ZWR2_9BURK|nr:UDP-N-acetylmuramate dehydrogenase [Undibacterium hunanense]MBC3920314.1 UDP-N-acetylmuramate dehydrogenase [Undibacterium hunanense]
MTNLSTLQADYPLQNLNTFGIAARARQFLQVESPVQLRAVFDDPALRATPRLILGGGSNVVLSDQVDALVLQMCLKGRRIVDNNDQRVLVEAAAGENWHEFVLWTLQHGLAGLENLSLIPGTVGAAPIQNIGAYGLEMQDVFDSLTAFDFMTGEMVQLDKAACRFAYRDSIFKHDYKDRMVILAVRFALPKPWQARLAYADVERYLSQRGASDPSPAEISDAIIAIRQAKLPDPAKTGNAGSFFKNPVVSGAKRDSLLEVYPTLVSHVQGTGDYKLAAGWLIDQCGWKGKHLGRAGVYEKQALVLVNRGGASGADVRALASAVQADVLAKFGVVLEVEPVFV